MKILHTADVHLRRYDDERWRALEHLIHIGRKEKVDVLVVCGDLFDKGVDAEKLKSAIRQIFSNNGFKILLIPGNHDFDVYKEGMYFGEDVVILSKPEQPYEHGNVVIWPLPFEHAEAEQIFDRLRILAKNFDPEKTNILLYHGELLDAFFSRTDFGDEGDQRYMPVKLSYFKDFNLDYVLAGHFHSKFDVYEFAQGKYFVYPGSPVSITRKEVSQRKVNLLEVGEPPREYPLDTAHFEEITITLDPFTTTDPVKLAKEKLRQVHPQAKIILRVNGYINSTAIKMSERELVDPLKEVCSEHSVEDLMFEFRDIHTVLEDDLFKAFLKKLEVGRYSEQEKSELRDIVIRAFMEAAV